MRVYIKDFLSRSEDGDSVTSAFHHFDPEDRARGYLLGLVSVNSPGELDASNIARFVWNGVLDEFMQNDGGSVTVMKQILEEAQKKLLDLIRNDENATDGVELNIVACHYQNDNLYFGYLGGSNLFILHELELVDVTSILKENSVFTGSAQIVDEDVILLTSPGFLEGSSVEDVITAKDLMLKLDQMKYELGEGCVAASTGVDLQTIVLFEKKDDMPQEVEIDVIPLVDSNLEGSTDIAEDNDQLSLEGDEIIVENENALSQDAFEAGEQSEVESDISTSSSVDIPGETEDRSVRSDGDHDRRDPKLPSGSEEEGSPSEVNELNKETSSDETLFTKPVEAIPEAFPQKAIFISKNIARKIVSTMRPLYTRIWAFISRSIRNLKAWMNRYLANKYGRKVWFKRLRARFSQSRIGTPQIKKMKLGDYRTRTLRNKRFLMLGSAVLILIALYTGYNTAKEVREKSLLHQQFTSFYEEVSTALESAKKEAKSDPEQAELKLLAVENRLEEEDFDLEKLNDEDQDLLSSIEGSILGVYDILDKVTPLSETTGNISVFQDLLAAANSQTPSDIAHYKDKNLIEYLLVTDPGLKAVHRYNLNDDSVLKIPDQNSVLQAPMFVDVGNDGVYVYDDVTGVVMAPFENGGSEIGTFVALSGISKDAFNIDSADEFAILGGDDNVYVLDSETLMVYRSVRYSSGSYGLPSNFLYIEPELTPTDFFADFNGYLLSSTGTTFNRYYFENGSYILSPWVIRGIRGEMGSISAGYAGLNVQHGLYLFETDHKSIMVFEKPDETTGLHPGEMVLKKRFVYRGDREDAFSSVSDIVVDSGETTLYILDGPTIWSVNLR